MQELINYFEALEARISALETEVAELKNRPMPEPQIVEKVVEKIVEKPVEVIKEVIKEVPVVVPAFEPTPEPEPIVEPEPVKEPEPIVEPEPTLAPDLFAEEPISPNAALYGKAVSDIRQAISLGDRFLYQRELFGQNAELMQRTLTELDALTSYDEAVNYISRFNWDTESNTYQQFLITLHRRFG